MNILKKTGKSLFALLVIATLSFIVYVNKDKYIVFYENALLTTGLASPCSKPIIYYIDNFDEKFGQNKTEFENKLHQASLIWNNIAGKKLFEYSPNIPQNISPLSGRRLAINLIYDQRQETTDQLKEIDSDINFDKENYNSLRQSYETLKENYDRQKKEISILLIAYDNDKKTYDNLIRNTNEQQSKDPLQIEKLRNSLNIKVNQINSLTNKLNSTISELNLTVNKINVLGKNINQKIDTFNDVSLANGREFQEGEFISDELGRRINIYQYENTSKLIRVLAHEFGHALDIEHTTGDDSIMFPYNLSSQIKASEEDKNALKKVCKIN